jgi:hypothetical protein
MFIELHSDDERKQPFSIAISHVTQVTLEDEKAVVHFRGDDNPSIRVRESYDTVLQMLKEGGVKVLSQRKPMTISPEAVRNSKMPSGSFLNRGRP